MTVEELIERLEEYPPELEVCISVWESAEPKYVELKLSKDEEDKVVIKALR